MLGAALLTLQHAHKHLLEGVVVVRTAKNALAPEVQKAQPANLAGKVGLLTLVREGLATRMHDCALRAAALEPTIERGGAYRLLSRLNASLPRVPFVSGWVERSQALPLAERAFAIDPDDPGNRLVLAVTLLERAPERRAEATALLESVSAATPRNALRAEDLAIREQARERLADERAP